MPRISPIDAFDFALAGTGRPNMAPQAPEHARLRRAEPPMGAAIAGLHNLTLSQPVVPPTIRAAERHLQEAARAALNELTSDIDHRRTPSSFCMMQLSRLLTIPSVSAEHRSNLAQDLAQALARRTFVVHDDVSIAAVELHVRLLAVAIHAMRGQNLRSYARSFQLALIEHLLELRQFAGDEDNPNTLFVLACLRNAIVQDRNDESELAACLRFGIGPAQIVAGAAMQQTGAMALGARNLARELKTARLKPDGWWADVQTLQTLSQSIGMRLWQNESVSASSTALLCFTGPTIDRELARLRRVDAAALMRIKQMFNGLSIRQVDNVWDLLFACLDTLHERAYAFSAPMHITMLFAQLDAVVCGCREPAILYKVHEILRDLRKARSLRPACHILLHKLALAGPAKISADVERKRAMEADIFFNILGHKDGQFNARERAQAPTLRMFALRSTGTLRVQPPRFERLALPAGEAVVAPVAHRLPEPGRAAPQGPDVALGIRLTLRPGEASALVGDALMRGDAAMLEGLLRAGVNIEDGGGVEVMGRHGRPEHVSALALCVRQGDRASLRLLLGRLGRAQGFAGPSEVRAARQATPRAGAPDLRADLPTQR